MGGVGHRIGDSVSVPGRGVRRLLVVLVVLMTAAAVGVAVALSAPAVARSFGLPVSAAAADAPAPVTPVPRLLATAADAPTPTPAGVAAALEGRTAGLGDLTGLVVDPATGTRLWERKPTEPQVPASSTKLLTSSAALLTLDATARLETSVVAGPTPDSVVLVGGGDPTVSSLPAGQESVYPGAAKLDDLVAQVRAARAATPGAPAIDTVYLDLSRYTGPTQAPGWESVDIAGGNFAPMTPVMLDGGRLVPTEVDGARTATPAQAAARELARRLGAARAQVETGPAPAGAAVLGRVASPPVDELVRIALQNSDNVLAEALGREVARTAGAPASFAGASQSVVRVLAERGVDVTGVALSDTSGLSTADRIPAGTLASVLVPAAAPDPTDPRTAALRPLLDGLPVAGGGGTLADRYVPGTPGAEGRGWVRAKTGTLTGTNALAGTVADRDGRVLVFAFMSNGADVLSARPRLDALAAALRGCGCR